MSIFKVFPQNSFAIILLNYDNFYLIMIIIININYHNLKQISVNQPLQKQSTFDEMTSTIEKYFE